MATKAKPSAKKKTSEKKKRATPIKFHDEKIDSIVKEITEGLKNDGESKETLEEEVAREIEEKKSGVSTAKSEDSEKQKITEEPVTKDENTLEVEKPFAEEEKEIPTESTEEKEDRKEQKEKSTEAEENSETGEQEEKGEQTPIFAPKEDNPFPPLDDEKKRSLKWPIIYLLLFVAGMVTGFVIFDQLSTRGNANLFSFATPTPTPTPAPTATPTPEEVDVSAYKIKIENGSGTAGEAAKLQKALEDAKFTVSDIGNADKSNYTKTVIQVKNGTNTQFLTKLEETLKKTYDVDDQTVTLPDSEPVDAVVIIGSKKASQ